MNVGALCHRPVVSVPSHATLAEAAARMREGHVGAVVVTRDAFAPPRVAGILTDRDILRAQLQHTADLSRLGVRECMSREPLVLKEDASIEEAIADLRARGVRRAPVVTQEDELIGLISIDDLLAQIASELSRVAEAMAQQVHRER